MKILKRQDLKVLTGVIEIRIGTMAGTCGSCNETSGSTKV
jgi:hypothetical protein